MKKIVSLALAAAAALAATPASAGSVKFNQDGSYRIEVPYSDLNLASPTGMRTLEGRMKSAVSLVCATGQAANINETRNADACRQPINEAARPQIAQAQQGAGRGIVVSEGR
jgi:UrcA family protein